MAQPAVCGWKASSTELLKQALGVPPAVLWDVFKNNHSSQPLPVENRFDALFSDDDSEDSLFLSLPPTTARILKKKKNSRVVTANQVLRGIHDAGYKCASVHAGSVRKPRIFVRKNPVFKLEKVNRENCMCVGDCIAPFRWGPYPTHLYSHSLKFHKFGSFYDVVSNTFFPLSNPRDKGYADLPTISGCCCGRFCHCSTLNGANGEATNEDDRNKGKNNTGKRKGKPNGKGQRKAILNEVKKDVKKVLHQKKGPVSRGLGAVPDTLRNAVIAQLNPGAVARCSASGLINTHPSQKISAIGRNNAISIANNYTMMIAIMPNFASDTTQVSVWGFLNTTGTLTGSTNAVFGTTSPAQGAGQIPTDGGTQVFLTTNTPYTQSTLESEAYNIKFVCGQLKLKNKGSELYRAGELLCLEDPEMQLAGAYDQSGTSTALNAATVYSAINSSSKTRVIPFLEEAKCVINGSDFIQPYTNATSMGHAGEWTTSSFNGHAVSSTAWDGGELGNTGLAAKRSAGPPIAYLMYSNTSGTAQDVSLEWLEHWEVNGQVIEMLHTPSPSHPTLHAALHTVVKHCKSQHAMLPKHSMPKLASMALKVPAVRDSAHGVEHILNAGIKAALGGEAGSAASGMAALLLG